MPAPEDPTRAIFFAGFCQQVNAPQHRLPQLVLKLDITILYLARHGWQGIGIGGFFYTGGDRIQLKHAVHRRFRLFEQVVVFRRVGDGVDQQQPRRDIAGKGLSGEIAGGDLPTAHQKTTRE